MSEDMVYTNFSFSLNVFWKWLVATVFTSFLPFLLNKILSLN